MYIFTKFKMIEYLRFLDVMKHIVGGTFEK